MLARHGLSKGRYIAQGFFSVEGAVVPRDGIRGGEVLKAREEMNGRKADTPQLKRKLSSIQSLLRLAEVIYQGVDGTPVGEE